VLARVKVTVSVPSVRESDKTETGIFTDEVFAGT
jgi:hypothetical protein